MPPTCTRIRIRTLGALQTYLGAERLEVELPVEATIRDLLDLIDQRWGQTLPERFWNREFKCFQGPVLIMTQGRDVYDKDTALAEGQEVMLLVPLSAG